MIGCVSDVINEVELTQSSGCQWAGFDIDRELSVSGN
jgi:hypothetical protein